jgi:GNAT superfamily N-acetyltransferase
LSPAVTIRDARPEDVELIFGWVVELATYERAADQVTGDETLLRDALFGERRSAEALIAEIDGEPVGFALYHGTFSTWEARPGIWLEDLYVPPERRRAGVGLALLTHLAKVTRERGCTRLEWSALEWNTPALNFYDKLGATRLHEWRVHRLDSAGLERVAAALDPPA